MIPKRTKSTLLAGLVLTGLTSGCFGNCGGCMGNNLGEGFEALGEALEKDLQADVEEGLQDEADRELALAEGREPKGSASGGLISYLNRADLAGLDADELKKRFAKLGYKPVGCEEMEFPSDDQSEVDCVFSSKKTRVKVQLHDFNRPHDLEDAAEGFLLTRHVAVRDANRILAVEVADEARSRNLLSKLGVTKVPSARSMRKRLVALGYQVFGCDRSEDADEVTLSCNFSMGSWMGMAIWMRMPADEIEEVEGDQGPEWTDELFLGQTRGRVTSLLMFTDREAGKGLAAKLLPDLAAKSERLVVRITMDDEKPNGKGWDALGGAPDPYIKVNGESYRDERCEDAYECNFVIPTADTLEIKVIDADGAKDDSAGKIVCGVGEMCETRGAFVQVVEVW